MFVVLIKRNGRDFRWVVKRCSGCSNGGFFFCIVSFRNDRRQYRSGKERNNVLVHGCEVVLYKIRNQFLCTILINIDEHE